MGDASVVLLNPRIIDADGGWQTWFFGNRVPGARLHRGFCDFMESELTSLCEWQGY